MQKNPTYIVRIYTISIFDLSSKIAANEKKSQQINYYNNSCYCVQVECSIYGKNNTRNLQEIWVFDKKGVSS